MNNPNKSCRMAICIPNESGNLAELIGILLGEGGVYTTLDKLP
jgi:hypothetical protein